MKAKQLLVDFIKQHGKSYISGIVILLATSFMAMTIPKILGIITDGLNSKKMPPVQINKYVILMLVFAVLVFGLKFTWRYLLLGNCRSVEVYLRDNLFKHLQTLPVSFYNNRKTGDLVAYAINDIQAVRQIFGFGTLQILDGGSAGLISIFFMAQTINPVLTLMALAPVPIAVFIMIKLGKHIRPRFRKVQEAFAAISEKVQENISGIRVIKAFAQEDEEYDNFVKYSNNRVKTQMKLTRISAFLGPCTQACFGVSFLLFIVYGGLMVIKGTITLGDYVAFNTYMATIMGPIMNISRIIDTWQRGMASYRRLGEIFDATQASWLSEEQKERGLNENASGNLLHKKAANAGGLKGSLEIRNLSFVYPSTTKKALKNINLKVKQGCTLGIIGRTGGGKTTLVNLLLRLYDVDNGHILYDGRDINDIPVDELRESIGYVPQDNFLFSTTIRDNIEFFRNIHTEDEIEQAARLSAVYDNIVEFPNGFRTIVGERGTTLSGGQKQRVSIARALVKDPSILMLDDSLSAVDTKTEEEILKNIKTVLENRTGIIISHRVSTVRNADEIIFMDGGKIVERGTHEQLMQLGGYYFSLYNSQAGLERDIQEVSSL